MSAIHFETPVYQIGEWMIVHLPKSASTQLPSRGLVMVRGTINNVAFSAALEPDGKGSHWFRIDDDLRKATGVRAGDTATLAIESTREWPEPEVPADILKALAADSEARSQWERVTPMARWEWIRWIRATNRLETRQRRIEVACSKLRSGERRPCCFNSSMCTEPAVSRNGVLLEPAQAA